MTNLALPDRQIKGLTINSRGEPAQDVVVDNLQASNVATMVGPVTYNSLPINKYKPLVLGSVAAWALLFAGTAHAQVYTPTSVILEKWQEENLSSLTIPAGDTVMISYSSTNPEIAENSIISGARIQNGETPGVRTDTGLVDASLLTDVVGSTTLSSEAAIALYADSGAGTESEPYLIENKRISNTEDAIIGLAFSGAEDIFIKVYNCWLSGYSVASIRSVKTNGHLQTERCKFTYDDTATTNPASLSTSHILMQGGSCDISVNGCEAPSGGRTFLRELAGYSGSITAYDNLIDDSEAAWTGAGTNQSVAFELGGTSPLLTANIHHNTVDGSVNGTMTYGVWLSTVRTGLATVSIENNYFNKTGSSGAGAGIGVAGASSVAHALTVKNNLFGPQNRDAINVNTCGSFELGYNEFEDSGVNFRPVIFNGIPGHDLDGIHVHHNKATSTGGANAEGFYFYSCITALCEYNYVVDCSDDCYEFTKPRLGSNICRYNVGNSSVSTGAIIDVFQDHATEVGTLEIHNMYGTSKGQGVSIDSRVSGDTISAIYIDTTSGVEPIVAIKNITLAPNNIRVMSPILGDEFSGSGTAVESIGVMGASVYFDGDQLT